MGVTIPIPIADLEIARELPSKTYMLDFERKRIYPLGSANGREAVVQFMKKALLTPRFRWDILWADPTRRNNIIDSQKRYESSWFKPCEVFNAY